MPEMSDGTDDGMTHEALGERELEILQLIAAGQSNRQIADTLYLSQNTVRWYNKQIYSKLHVNSRTLAVARARELGVLGRDSGAEANEQAVDAIPLTNLPAQLTAFVGREQELDELLQLIQDEAVRLVTIAGPGGMGKTRISQEVARGQVGHFRDGVYLVELAPVQADRDQAYQAVLNTIATTLHITLGEDPESQVLTYLSRKQMLLLVDNFEHLSHGADILAHILAAAPDVKVLTTSRNVLGLYGEAVYHLDAMAMPAADDAEDADAYDAIQLFIQSAQRVNADFEPARQDLRWIAQICALVEGLPLGIELAAAWARSLSLPEILDELKQGLDILETRANNIRSVFDRSWALLTDDEQTAFVCMSIFPGGCTRDAAQTVTGASLRMLTSLVDKSLLWHLPDAHYAMHELLRQYAAEKFEHLPEADSVLQRHCAYYAAFAGQWGRALTQGQQADALAAIEREFDNIRAAWHYAARMSDDDALKDLIDLAYFFDMRGRWQEGNELFNLAMPQVRDPLTLARLLARQTNFMFRVGQADRIHAQAQQSIDMFREAGAEGEIGLPLLNQGNVALMEGDVDTADVLWQEGLEIARGHDDKLIVAATLGNLSLIEKTRENIDQARSYLQQQLAIGRDMDDHMITAMALINLGEIAREHGDLDTARTYYQSSLATAQRIGQQFVIAGALGQLGWVARQQQQLAEARRLLEQSLAINRESNNRLFVVRNLALLGEVAADEGDDDEAQRHYREALTLVAELRAVPIGLLTLVSVAYGLAVWGRLAQAVEIFTLVATHALVNREDQGRATRLRADLAERMDPATYEAALKRGQEIDMETMLTALTLQAESGQWLS